METEIYEGPTLDMNDVFTKMSDSGNVVLILKAPKQLDHENGDRFYPEGLNLEYFQKNQSPICTFQSNSATYSSAMDLWKGEGNVIVKNLENGDELNTEELFWSPQEKRFYTEKFVTIVSEGELHKGEGLTADQNFNSYRIHKPTGTISVDEKE